MMSIYQVWRRMRGDAPAHRGVESTQPMPVAQDALDKTEFAASELTEAIRRTMDAIRERSKH